METESCLQLGDTTVIKRNGKRKKNEESVEKEEGARVRFCHICRQKRGICTFIRSGSKMHIIDFFLGTDLVNTVGSRIGLFVCRSHYYEEFEKKTKELYGSERSVVTMNRLITAGFLRIPGLKTEVWSTAGRENGQAAPSASDSDGFTSKSISPKCAPDSRSEEANPPRTVELQGIRFQTRVVDVRSLTIAQEKSVKEYRWCDICYQRTDSFCPVSAVNKMHIIDFVLGSNLVQLLGTRRSICICRRHYYDEFEEKTEKLYGSRRSVEMMSEMNASGKLAIPMKMGQPEESDKSPILLLDKCDSPLKERRVKLEEKEEVFRMSGENNNQLVETNYEMNGVKILQKVKQEGIDDIKPNMFNEYEMVDVEQLMGRF